MGNSRSERLLALHDAKEKLYGPSYRFHKRRYLTESLQRELIRSAFRLQDGKCAVCGFGSNLPDTHRHTLVTDHCHECGKFRGWLCDWCNSQLLPVFDSPAHTRVFTACWWFPPPIRNRMLTNEALRRQVIDYLRNQCGCWR